MSPTVRANFDVLLNEGDGQLSIYVIRKTEVPALLCAAMGDDEHAARLAHLAVNSLGHVESAPKHDPIPCGCCLRPVRRGSAYRIGAAMPRIDLPRHAMGFALCERCCATEASANQAAVQAVSEVWPAKRTVVISHPGGSRA